MPCINGDVMELADNILLESTVFGRARSNRVIATMRLPLVQLQNGVPFSITSKDAWSIFLGEI